LLSFLLSFFPSLAVSSARVLKIKLRMNGLFLSFFLFLVSLAV
jgi:hypothetical protein